jgi:hypothetical protein
MTATSFRKRLIGQEGGVAVWRVDGWRVRDQVDVDFTNGHHHFTRPYVPVDEIWIDREAPRADDTTFWVLRALTERARMAAGGSFGQAIWAGRRAERAARRQAVDGISLSWNDLRAQVRRQRLGTVEGREVFLVRGRLIRDHAFVDFTLGGHGYRYPFISRGEIWIDDAVAPGERDAILCHEVTEVGHMATGMKYNPAHELASAAERRFRQRARRRKLL